MRVLMIAPGTRGDVAPMAGLGSRLIPRGFEVAIAAIPAYRELVAAAGCEYRELPDGIGDLVTPAPPAQKPTRADLHCYLDELGAYMQLAAQGTLAATQAGAEVIMANSIAPYAYDVAEALGMPALGAPATGRAEFRLPADRAGHRPQPEADRQQATRLAHRLGQGTL